MCSPPFTRAPACIRAWHQMGDCGTECRTVARACTDILEEADLTELSAMLVKGVKQRAQIRSWLCYEATESCAKKTPPLAKVRPFPPPPHPAPSCSPPSHTARWAPRRPPAPHPSYAANLLLPAPPPTHWWSASQHPASPSPLILHHPRFRPCYSLPTSITHLFHSSPSQHPGS